jgi:DNA gyrase/topoisomerase IV subunit B
LLKIINEIIDNAFDIAIKTNFKECNSISVNITSKYVEVIDNGPGIPVKEVNGQWMPTVAWGSAKSGSNFDDEKNQAQLGLNGVGSFCTNCFSKIFIGISDDGKKRLTCEFSNNAKDLKEVLTKSQKHGVYVHFEPDLEKFGLTEITREHIEFIRNEIWECSRYIASRFVGEYGKQIIEESRLARAIVQIDKEGNVIKEYSSILEICQAFNRERGDNIRNVLNGKQKTAYGFFWKYKKDM